MKIEYQNWRPSRKSLAVVECANQILEDYATQGLDLTLRQLYYQFVSRDLIANRQSEYKKLGDIVSNARLAGLISWQRIVDRTRFIRKQASWDDPESIIRNCAEQFHRNRWETQDNRVEVWIEKDALIGVIEGVCRKLDVPHFSCRGYVSQSEMWSAAQRMRYADVETTVLHLGDHDPSGIDMTRDIQERLNLFGADVSVKRIALNMEQVEKLNPPPNPAKLTDSRAEDYVRKYGNDSWELDAIEPAAMISLIESEIKEFVDPVSWEETEAQERDEREALTACSDRWGDVVKFLETE